MKRQKMNKLALAIAAASLTINYAQAQEAEQNANDLALEEVTVTGFRSSVLNSIDVKRNSDVVAEIIDAGDLGALPDVSIADALGRLPGVTTVRDSGQSSQLNIRGMNGDFIQSTLNGREQSSTSGYTAGSRWISFDQYPSELITQAAVYKSPKASLIEGGVAATVELKTANPLDAPHDHNFKANVRLSYNDAAENVGADANGSRISFSYQGKFLDETLGINLGYAKLDQPNNAEESRSGPDDPPAWATHQLNGEAVDYNGDGVADFVPKGFQVRAANGVDDRTGLISSVVFEPNDSLSLQFDYFRSEFDSEDTRYGYTLSGLTKNADIYSLTDTQVENGYVTAGRVELTGLTGPWIEMRSEDQTTSSLTESYGLLLSWQVNDAISADLDIAKSTGEKTRLDRIATLHAYEFGTGTEEFTDDMGNPATRQVNTWRERSGQGFTFATRPGGVPRINFIGDTDYTDLSYMRLSEWEQFPHLYTDDIDSVKFDVEWEMSGDFVSSVEFGVRSSERVFGAERGTFRYGQREGQAQLIQGADGDINNGILNGGTGPLVTIGCENNPSGVACEPQDVTGFVSQRTFGGSLSGFGDYLAIDMKGIADQVFGPGNYDGVRDWNHNWTLIQTNQVTEKTLAAYAMVNFETEIGNTPVTGNFGVRVIETDIKSTGIQQLQGLNGAEPVGDSITDDLGVTRTDYVNVKYGPEFTDVLPSVNLNFELSENDQLRFSAAKVMGRPPVDKLRAGNGSWVDTANDGVSPRYNAWSQGNPNLDPFRANQIDVSYEHYFEDGGAWTAAIFYKDIESLVEDITYTEGQISWSEIGLQAPPGFVEGTFQTAQNNDLGGYIQGVELAVTKTFDMLPGALSGLGATASYSYTDSETAVNAAGPIQRDTLPLPGLSQNVWSGTLFYDYENFSTNINARYRDSFTFSGVSPGGAALQVSDEYLVADLQMSYSFDMGVDLLFQVNNLTDEASSTNYGTAGATGEVKSFGRQYFFGVAYSF